MALIELEPLIHLIVWPIVGVTVAAAIALKWFRKRETFFKLAALNPDYGLAKQLLFWMAILIPLVYFVEFGLIVWSDYKPSLDKAGFDTFIEISKLPVLLLSLAIPLTALVAKLHSTAQTARQIEKNKHELFYLHRKEFTSYYQQIGDTNYWGEFKATYKINPRIHGRLFQGEVADGTPTLKADVIDKWIDQLKKIRKHLEDTLNSSSVTEGHAHYIQFCRRVLTLTHFFSIRDIEEMLESKGVLIPGEGELRTVGLNTRRAADVCTVLEGYLIAAVEFSGYEKGKELMRYDKGAFKRLIACHRDDRVIGEITNLILEDSLKKTA